MTKDLFEQEFIARCQSKMAGLSKDDCPYSDEEFAAYKEGWLAAWQLSVDILAKMMRETKDLTDEHGYKIDLRELQARFE